MSEVKQSRIRRAINAFMDINDDVGAYSAPSYGTTSFGGYRPHQNSYISVGSNQIVQPIYNRMAIDVSLVDIRHIRVDADDRYVEDLNTRLNTCLRMDPNIDQTPDAFYRDIVMTMCDAGAAVIVPVESIGNPFAGEAFEPTQLRVGTVVEWEAQFVRVRVYNDRTGQYEEIRAPKRAVAIIENPLHAVMNGRNSTVQRLIQKLSLIDQSDSRMMSGKLDIILQLPFSTRTESRERQAEKRKQALEQQMNNSVYGVGYIDSSEKLHQLNRPAENNLMVQVEYLVKELHSQLGITEEVLLGTADEETMLNYHSRTIEPFLMAITKSMTRIFLSQTALSQGQRVAYYRDPFKLVPVGKLAEVADKFTRNEIASSNEIRTSIGWKPSKDPKADELRNSNLSAPKGEGEVKPDDNSSSEPESEDETESVKTNPKKPNSRHNRRAQNGT